MSKPTTRRHLPLLLNPFLNVLFNNPSIEDSATLKSIIKKLSLNPDEYVLLVPDTKFILLHSDYDSSRSYKELCHNPDFIQSHIININLKKYPDLKKFKKFTTLNNKEIIIKGNILTSSKGFKHNFKVRILEKTFFKSFAPYIPFGTDICIFIIEEPLTGIPQERGIKKFKVSNTLTVGANEGTSNENPQFQNNTTTSNHLPASYEELASAFPILSISLGSKFNELFESFNVESINNNMELNDQFIDIMSNGSKIFNSLSDNIYRDIIKKFPGIQLHQCIYSYIETRIYDKFWAMFVHLNASKSDSIINKSYESVRNISITQVGLPNPDGLQGILITLEKRVKLASEQFSQLNVSKSSQKKCEILNQTFKTLSEGTTPDTMSPLSTIDADTLISLLVMVILISKVKDLNTHLNYIKKHSYSSEFVESGFQGYVISTFEATLNYLDNTQTLQEFIKFSEDNYECWNLIKSVSSDYNDNNVDNDSSKDELLIDKVAELLQPYESGVGIPYDSVLRSRTSQGESLLMLSILQNNCRLFKRIIDFEYIFTLDDILEDRSLDGASLLVAALQSKNVPIIDEIANIILEAEPTELQQYCNSKDKYNRNLGHFLFHRYELIPKFGKFINWTDKDNNKQTPLFSIIRCYDHPNYEDLVVVALKTVSMWYESMNKAFDYRDHIDGKGNTLIHSIRDGTSLKFFLDNFQNINPNELNFNNLSPLMQFIKYNKLSNIKELIKDERLDLLKNDQYYYMTALDYVKVDKINMAKLSEDAFNNLRNDDSGNVKVGSEPNDDVNREIMDAVDSEFVLTYLPMVDGRSFGIVRAKFDINHELLLYFRTVNQSSTDNEKSSQWVTVIRSLADFLKLIKLLKLKHPNSIINSNDNWFTKSYEIGDRANVDFSNKLKINKRLMSLNILLTCILFNHELVGDPLIWDFIATQKPLDEVKLLKEIKSDFNASRCLTVTSDQLKPEEIGNYKTFLRYSGNELTEFKALLERLYKISVFVDIKNKDLQYVVRHCLLFASGSNRIDSIDENLEYTSVANLKHIQFLSQTMDKFAFDSTNELFINSIKFLRNSIHELVHSLDSFVTTKITKWWDLYGEIKAIDQELKKILKIENQVSVSKSNDNDYIAKLNEALLDIGNLLGSIDADIINDLSANNSIAQVNPSRLISTGGSAGVGNAEIVSTSSYFIGIIEARRHSFSDRLIETYRKLRAEIIELDADIKKGYENLCVEISNFYPYKKDFIRYMFKQLASTKLNEQRLQLHSLRKGLKNFRV